MDHRLEAHTSSMAEGAEAEGADNSHRHTVPAEAGRSEEEEVVAAAGASGA